MNIIEALGIITRYWPELFPDGQLRPMKNGLREDLFQDKKNQSFTVVSQNADTLFILGLSFNRLSSDCCCWCGTL